MAFSCSQLSDFHDEDNEDNFPLNKMSYENFLNDNIEIIQKWIEKPTLMFDETDSELFFYLRTTTNSLLANVFKKLGLLVNDKDRLREQALIKTFRTNMNTMYRLQNINNESKEMVDLCKNSRSDFLEEYNDILSRVRGRLLNIFHNGYITLFDMVDKEKISQIRIDIDMRR